MKTVPKVIRVDTGRIDASGQPIIEEKIETKIITGNRVQEIQTLSTDEVYQQFKHEYSNSVIGDIESQKGTPPPTVGGGMNTPTPGGTIGN